MTTRSVRLGRTRLELDLHPAGVLLCDDAAAAQDLVRALAASGAHTIDGSEAPRGTLADALGRAIPLERAQALADDMRLPGEVLQWRPRDCSTLQRVLGACLLAVLRGVDDIVIDTTRLAGSPFDIAHLFAFVRELRARHAAGAVVVIADAAYISSAGEHLAVISGDTVLEQGMVAQVLASPASEAFLRRLEATPVPSPLAMQARRVQRAATRPVNYAHTQVIALPTQDSVALAGGDEEAAPPA